MNIEMQCTDAAAAAAADLAKFAAFQQASPSDVRLELANFAAEWGAWPLGETIHAGSTMAAQLRKYFSIADEESLRDELEVLHQAECKDGSSPLCNVQWKLASEMPMRFFKQFAADHPLEWENFARTTSGRDVSPAEVDRVDDYEMPMHVLAHASLHGGANSAEAIATLERTARPFAAPMSSRLQSAAASVAATVAAVAAQSVVRFGAETVSESPYASAGLLLLLFYLHAKLVRSKPRGAIDSGLIALALAGAIGGARDVVCARGDIGCNTLFVRQRQFDKSDELAREIIASGSLADFSTLQPTTPTASLPPPVLAITDGNAADAADVARALQEAAAKEEAMQFKLEESVVVSAYGKEVANWAASAYGMSSFQELDSTVLTTFGMRRVIERWVAPSKDPKQTLVLVMNVNAEMLLQAAMLGQIGRERNRMKGLGDTPVPRASELLRNYGALPQPSVALVPASVSEVQPITLQEMIRPSTHQFYAYISRNRKKIEVSSDLSDDDIDLCSYYCSQAQTPQDLVDAYAKCRLTVWKWHNVDGLQGGGFLVTEDGLLDALGGDRAKAAAALSGVFGTPLIQLANQSQGAADEFAANVSNQTPILPLVDLEASIGWIKVCISKVWIGARFFYENRNFAAFAILVTWFGPVLYRMWSQYKLAVERAATQQAFILPAQPVADCDNELGATFRTLEAFVDAKTAPLTFRDVLRRIVTARAISDEDVQAVANAANRSLGNACADTTPLQRFDVLVSDELAGGDRQVWKFFNEATGNYNMLPRKRRTYAQAQTDAESLIQSRNLTARRRADNSVMLFDENNKEILPQTPVAVLPVTTIFNASPFNPPPGKVWRFPRLIAWAAAPLPPALVQATQAVTAAAAAAAPAVAQGVFSGDEVRALVQPLLAALEARVAEAKAATDANTAAIETLNAEVRAQLGALGQKLATIQIANAELLANMAALRFVAQNTEPRVVREATTLIPIPSAPIIAPSIAPAQAVSVATAGEEIRAAFRGEIVQRLGGGAGRRPLSVNVEGIVNTTGLFPWMPPDGGDQVFTLEEIASEARRGRVVMSVLDVEALLFQLVWTLAAAQSVWPGFTHGAMRSAVNVYRKAEPRAYKVRNKDTTFQTPPRAPFPVIFNWFGATQNPGNPGSRVPPRPDDVKFDAMRDLRDVLDVLCAGTEKVAEFEPAHRLNRVAASNLTPAILLFDQFDDLRVAAASPGAMLCEIEDFVF